MQRKGHSVLKHRQEVTFTVLTDITVHRQHVKVRRLDVERWSTCNEVVESRTYRADIAGRLPPRHILAVRRALLPLLKPFSSEILIHDPWVQPAVLQAQGALSVSLDECFARCRVVFILAAITEENAGKIGARQFKSMQPGSVVILGSRAALVNFPELLAAARCGQIRAGIDVWPEEPIPKDEPGRNVPNTLVQAHRLGSVPEIQTLIGRIVADDLEAILAGREPTRCQRANLETVMKLRSIPVGAWSLSDTSRQS